MKANELSSGLMGVGQGVSTTSNRQGIYIPTSPARALVTHYLGLSPKSQGTPNPSKLFFLKTKAWKVTSKFLSVLESYKTEQRGEELAGPEGRWASFQVWFPPIIHYAFRIS